MKAAVLNSYDDAKFDVEEVEKPDPAIGQVLVEVAATSVNTVDTKMLDAGPENIPFSPQAPAIFGMDFAGTVAAIGEGVTGFSVGDEVYGCAGGLGDLQGALAEYIPADAKLIAHKPKSLSMREAAALPLVGITAYEGLKRAGLAANQRVLVHGGAGGVGHVAVQLAAHWGAKVFSTVSNDKDGDIVSGYGATPINYREQAVTDYVDEHTGGAGFDLVYDSVGGANMVNSMEAAALNGHVATTTSMIELDLTIAHMKGLSLHVVFMLIPMIHDVKREEHGEILRDIARIVDAGALRPLVDQERFSLDTVAAAYSKLNRGDATGKLVIAV